MQSIHESIRLARRIHAAYEQRAAQALLEQQADWSHLEECFFQAQQQHRLIEKAASSGWRLAADKHAQHLPAVLRACSEAVRAMQDQLLEPSYQPSRLADLLAELQHLDAEFDDVLIDKKHFLAVQTETIVLEGIDLGRFSIRLHWPRLAQQVSADCFEVVPLDPRPASSNDDLGLEGANAAEEQFAAAASGQRVIRFAGRLAQPQELLPPRSASGQEGQAARPAPSWCAGFGQELFCQGPWQ